MSSQIAARIPVVLSSTGGTSSTRRRNVTAFGERNAVSEHLCASSQNVAVHFVHRVNPLERIISDVATVLGLYGIEQSLHETIIYEMLTGDHDQPAFEADPSDPILARYGHIMLPMIHAGVDYATAARVTDLLLDLPTAHLLHQCRRHGVADANVMSPAVAA